MEGIPNRKDIALIVVDVQEKFRPAIFEFDKTVENISKLVRAFDVLGIPVLRTEQYPKGLGNTILELAKLFKERPVEKSEFSCLRNKEFKEKLEDLGVHELVVCGIEAHVCVLQTALDAIKEGYEVYLVEDATSSRKQSDCKTAVKRAGQSGVYQVSTEMIIFQLLEKAGTEEFKEVQKIVK